MTWNSLVSLQFTSTRDLKPEISVIIDGIDLQKDMMNFKKTLHLLFAENAPRIDLEIRDQLVSKLLTFQSSLDYILDAFIDFEDIITIQEAEIYLKRIKRPL